MIVLNNIGDLDRILILPRKKEVGISNVFVKVTLNVATHEDRRGKSEVGVGTIK